MIGRPGNGYFELRLPVSRVLDWQIMRRGSQSRDLYGPKRTK